MAGLWDLSVEVLARIFELMDHSAFWTARGVCRAWLNVWEYVANARSPSHLNASTIKVDVICCLKSEKGQHLDHHVIDGELELDSGGGRIAKWTTYSPNVTFWPGGSWRKYEMNDLLSDIRFRLNSDFLLRVQDITLHSRHSSSLGIENTIEQGIGAYEDFCLSFEVHEEKINGKVHKTHSITSFQAPRWKIYSLLAQHAQRQHRWIESVGRHYLQSTQYLRGVRGD